MNPKDQERLEATVSLIGQFHHNYKERKKLIELAVRLMRPRQKPIVICGLKLSQSQIAEIHEVFNYQGKKSDKLEAVKFIRGKYGLSLMDAKHAFEELEQLYRWDQIN